MTDTAPELAPTAGPGIRDDSKSGTREQWTPSTTSSVLVTCPLGTPKEISDVVLATGRRLLRIPGIQVEMLEDLRIWPVTHLQSKGVTGYVIQVVDGGVCVDSTPR
jgi:hypothetical protein